MAPPLQQVIRMFTLESISPPLYSLSRKNLILADAMEERTIYAKDYYDQGESNQTQVLVRRPLQQAMVPGAHLVQVQMAKADHDARLG